MLMLAPHIFANVSAETNSVDSDQTDPIGSVQSESTLFDQKASKTNQQRQMIFVVIGHRYLNQEYFIL